MIVHSKQGEMAQADKLGLSARHLQLIHRIVVEHPNVNRVWIFGSRAMGSYKPSSDIDIAVEGEEITLADKANMLDQFDQSTLPFKVDLVIKHQITSDELLSHIEQYGVEISD